MHWTLSASVRTHFGHFRMPKLVRGFLSSLVQLTHSCLCVCAAVPIQIQIEKNFENKFRQLRNPECSHSLSLSLSVSVCQIIAFEIQKNNVDNSPNPVTLNICQLKVDKSLFEINAPYTDTPSHASVEWMCNRNERHRISKQSTGDRLKIGCNNTRHCTIRTRHISPHSHRMRSTSALNEMKKKQKVEFVLSHRIA